MSIFKAVILGLIQGVTEFLPVSSSGHLAVFGQDDAGFGLYTIVLMHVGTLLSIVVYYRRDLLGVLSGGMRLAGGLLPARRPGRTFSAFLAEDAGARLALLLIAGTIPTGLIGLGLGDVARYAATPGHLKIVGAMFIITGMLMYLADKFPPSSKWIGHVSARDSIVVGIFQGLAVMPGLSRSGLTVFAGVMRGIDRRDAARLSFLLAVPALIGAMILELGDAPPGGSLVPGLVGMATAFVSGYLSLAILIRVLVSRNLRYFTGYLVAMGLLTLFLSR